MINRIDAYSGSLITREELTVQEWSKKLDRLISVTSFIDDDEFINQFTFEYNLNTDQIENLRNCINSPSTQYHRYSCSKYEHFKVEPVHLNIRSIKGKLIYWKDWDFIFRKFEDDYYLWCFLGGIAYLQREIKLSEDQVGRFNKIGLAEIDYLIDDLKKVNGSLENDKAIKEGRKIL
jgi:hypothetical protein